MHKMLDSPDFYLFFWLSWSTWRHVKLCLLLQLSVLTPRKHAKWPHSGSAPVGMRNTNRLLIHRAGIFSVTVFFFLFSSSYVKQRNADSSSCTVVVNMLWFYLHFCGLIVHNYQKSGPKPAKEDSPAVEMSAFFTGRVCGGSERQPVKANQPTTTS